jgi:hypothetical protein
MLIAAIFFISICLTAAPLFAESGGRVQVENNFWDFGSVPADFKLIHFFKIGNVGADNLRLQKIISNCDCTSAHVLDTLILPGENTSLKITYNTRDFYGKNVKNVVVETSDSLSPIIEFEYSANIEYFHKLHTIEPKYLTFLKDQERREIALVNRSNMPVDFIIEQEPDELFTLDKNSGTIPPNENNPLVINVRNGLPKGTYYSNFTVTYSTEPPLRLSVPVKIVRY